MVSYLEYSILEKNKYYCCKCHPKLSLSCKSITLPYKIELFNVYYLLKSITKIKYPLKAIEVKNKNYWLIRKNLYNINSNPSNYIMTDVAKIIEIVGSSAQGWEEAVQVALNEAGKTIKGITGVEVIDMTGKVDPSTGKINLYKVAVKIAFGVQHS